MSLLIQAIPQWSVVYTTCFETMWPESGEKLNGFLGESQGLSVNLEGLCSLLHWLPSSPLAPSPEAQGAGSAPQLTHQQGTAPVIQSTTSFPTLPPFRLKSCGLPPPASPRSLCLRRALGPSTVPFLPSRPGVVCRPMPMRGAGSAPPVGQAQAGSCGRILFIYFFNILT